MKSFLHKTARTLIAKKKIIILVLILGLFGAIGISQASSRTPTYETVSAKRMTLSRSVIASGEIRSEDEVDLKFPISGKIAYLAVKKNDRVKAGSYIASLDKRVLQKTLEKSLRDYSKTRNDFDEMHITTYKDQVITDTIRRILEKNQWDLDKSVMDVELADLTKQYADLVSPIDGVVTNVVTPAGTSEIAATTIIVTIANPDNISLIARVGESDIASVAVGQEAIYTLDAFEGKKFKGKVKEIDYAATTGTGGKSYLVKIGLEDTTGVKLDMGGDVEIIADSRQNALVLPRGAVQEKNGQKYVEVLNGKDIKQETVTTGMKGTGGLIEILSGLKEGEQVTIPTKK